MCYFSFHHRRDQKSSVIDWILGALDIPGIRTDLSCNMESGMSMNKQYHNVRTYWTIFLMFHLYARPTYIPVRHNSRETIWYEKKKAKNRCVDSNLLQRIFKRTTTSIICCCLSLFALQLLFHTVRSLHLHSLKHSNLEYNNNDWFKTCRFGSAGSIF